MAVTYEWQQTHVWTDSEGVLRSRVFCPIPGVRCELCSTGVLAWKGVYHPAGRACASTVAPVGTVRP